MAQQQSPWLEGAYGWNFGEGGWNTGMDSNLLKFSFMFDRNVDSVVAFLPSAVNGQAHFLTTDNRLYFAVGTTYFSTPTPKWFEFKDRSTGNTYQFNGTNAIQIDSPLQLDARLDAVELTVSTLGTAALENIEFFATQAALDVVEAASATYTDTLRQDLADDTDPAKGAGLVGYRGYTQQNYNDEVLYEKYWGVIRDGVSDDTAALQAVINTAAAANKILVSGPGVSMHTGLTIPSNFRWHCLGSVSRLIANTDASLLTNSDTIGGNANIEIRGLELDGNAANQGAISRPAALFKNCTNIHLYKVKAHDAKITTYGTDTYDQILFVDCFDCEVEKCESYNQIVAGGLGFYGTGGRHRLLFNYVHDCVAGIEGAYQTDSHLFGNRVENSDVGLISWSGLRNIIYRNNVRDSSAGAGIVCGHSGTPTQVADGSYVTENTIEDVFSYGVTVFSSADVTVEGNKITRTSGDSSHSIFINTGCSRVSVLNNDIRDYFTTAAGASGIFVDGCADLTAIGNKVYGATGGTTGNGIRLFNACPDAEISGGRIVDTVGIAVNVSSTSPECIVNGVRVMGSGGVGIQVAGAGASVSGCIVKNAAGAQGILISGGSTAVTGNRVTNVNSGAGVGIFINAVDFNTVVGNTVSTCATGVSLPSGTDHTVAAANSFALDVTTKVNVGTNTGTKVAHNIGLATHEV